MSEDPEAGASPGASNVSSWVLVVAAVAGIGAGAGASLAVGRAGPVESSEPPADGETAESAARVAAIEAAGVEPIAIEDEDEPVAPEADEEQVEPDEEEPVEVPPLEDGDPPIDPALVQEALDEVFAGARVDRAFAGEFYDTYGAGRFAGAAGPTDLGAAIIERVRRLDEHAISAVGYDVEELEALAAGASEGELSPRSRARLDVKLFSTLTDLVMDFRFLHKAGPFVLRSRETVFEREKKKVKAFMALLLMAPDGRAAMATLDPPHPQYQQMKAVLARYRAMAEATRQPDSDQVGCPKLPENWRFREGSRGKEVEKLQRRLACEGYYDGPIDGRYEGASVEAVKAYQEQHDLPAEGHVLKETIRSMNVPLTHRVMQIELALQRMREARFERMGDYFIRVNLPSFRFKVYEHGQVIKEHKVIIGTNRLDDDKVKLVQGHINRTKLFGTELYQVIVNPTWILPKRVEEGELQTSIEKDEDYLEKQNIKKIRLGSGTEVFVQGAGDGNVLGKVKFLLKESNAIYLHDTDKRHLFKKWRRDFSHGCIRVHEAIDFARWLLMRDGYSEEEIDKSLRAKRLQRGFDLRRPVNLVTEYITVDLTAAGDPIFYSDIYDYDEDYWKGELPPRETTRWGAVRLRPRWVPRMDKSIVDGWRAAGKPAPRDLGPDGKPKAPKKKAASKDEEGDEGGAGP